MKYMYYGIGILILSLGISLTIQSGLGTSPFDALLVGLSKKNRSYRRKLGGPYFCDPLNLQRYINEKKTYFAGLDYSIHYWNRH